ncbi:hypothetical protein BJX63DRAFT_19695 [Aspergillus granulosus]|uniref:Uncharacterized protein n=1 Tax=Aspergillus granulosus TaxID=176169 RepID=A0ABR4H005_9EURO
MRSGRGLVSCVRWLRVLPKGADAAKQTKGQVNVRSQGRKNKVRGLRSSNSEPKGLSDQCEHIRQGDRDFERDGRRKSSGTCTPFQDPEPKSTKAVRTLPSTPPWLHSISPDSRASRIFYCFTRAPLLRSPSLSRCAFTTQDL